MQMAGVTWPKEFGPRPTLSSATLDSATTATLAALQGALREFWDLPNGPSLIFAALCGVSEDALYEMHRWLVATGETGDSTSRGLDERDLLAAFNPNARNVLVMRPENPWADIPLPPSA